MRNELQDLLDAAGNGVAGNFAASNFESYEEAAVMENYIMRKQGVDQQTAQSKLRGLQAQGRLNDVRTMIKREPGSAAAGGLMKEGEQGVSIGNFELVATRLTANLAMPLPIAFLSPMMMESNYEGVVPIPSGLTLQITGGSRDNLPNEFRFTYTDGTDTDIITVSTSDSALAYPSFMLGCVTDKFRATNIRYIVPDSTAPSLAQLKNSIQFFTASTFGTTQNKKLSTSVYRDPTNFIQNILDVQGVFTFDKERGLFTNMNAVAGLEISLSMFLQKLFRDTADNF